MSEHALDTTGYESAGSIQGFRSRHAGAGFGIIRRGFNYGTQTGTGYCEFTFGSCDDDSAAIPNMYMAKWIWGNSAVQGVMPAYLWSDGSLYLHGGEHGEKMGLPKLKELTTILDAASTETAIEIPAGCVLFGVGWKSVTTIPGITSWDLGIGGATTKYGTGLSPSAAAGVSYGAGPEYFAAAKKLLITPNTTPSGATGSVRFTLHYLQITGPTS
jgi:hypothetical protein